MRSRNRLRLLLKRGFTIGLAAAPLLLGGLWLALHHKPDWYKPRTLDEEGVHQARSETVAMADYVSDRMVEGKPFDVVLRDRSINGWLAALPAIWPDAREVLPPEIHHPAVRFDDGCIRIGTHYVSRRWQAIVSVTLTTAVSRDGTAIEIALVGARGGSLPVPVVLLERILEPMLRDMRAARAEECRMSISDCRLEEIRPTGPHSALDNRQSTIDIAVEELFDGIRVKNRFVWFNGRRPFRIDSIRIEPGELRLRIDPL